MARFTDTKQPKTPTAPRPDNFRTYLAVRRSRFVPREAPLRDASNSPVSSPARALRIATPRTQPRRNDAAEARRGGALEERAGGRVLRRLRADARGGPPGVLRGGSPAEASIDPTCRPSTPSACRCAVLRGRPARDARRRSARGAAAISHARGGAPPVTEGHARGRGAPPVAEGRRPAAAEGPSVEEGRRVVALRAPQTGRRRRRSRAGGRRRSSAARFAGAAPSKLRGVVSARLRCTKCAHDVSRFAGYRWRPTAAYLHFRNYHPDPARLLEEAEAADGHAAYCCQCAWLDAVELRDLGCDHAWVGY